MSDKWTFCITLLLCGVIPFALAGGWTNDLSIWPWAAGFLCPAGYEAWLHRETSKVVEFKLNTESSQSTRS